MLKLLLGHWQAHREPLPFVLTDDPLYCSHLTKSPFPEVYSVNRVNPIFEDDENETPAVHLKRSISENETRFSDYSLKRSLSEERREEETKASDDTGYSSSGHLKSVTTADSLSDDAASLRHMSSDSDDYSQPEAVVVSVDVHRVSYPEDVIVLSSSSSPSQTFSANSISSHYSDSSPEPYDSLTMSSVNEDKQKAESKKPTSAVRERLQRLLEKGNDQSTEMFLDSLEARPPAVDHEVEKTKNDLMKSLTRVLNSKVPNKEDEDSGEMVTRTDSALDLTQKSLDQKSISSSTSPKALYFSNSSTNGVTRQDESSASSSISFVKHKKPRNTKHPAEKEAKRGSLGSSQESSDSKKSHKCKLCENAKRPLAFHQLLPGHWSYDNVYLPQISGMCCSCMHHPPSFPPSSDDDVFYPLYYPHDVARARHSWASHPTPRGLLENVPKRKRSAEDKSISTTTSKDKNQVPSNRYSPDGSSRDTTDSSQTDSSPLKKSLTERRSLREPKKCKCEHCLESVLDKSRSHPHLLGSHTCPCHCLPHRRVKFASDTDVSQHKHMHSVPIHLGKDVSKLANGETINAAFVMNLKHLNGHALSNSQGVKENGLKSKKTPPLIPRGLKEPIKMDELYRSYPINFREWEAHYRRTFLQKRRRRALNMVGMAIGIIMVVGIAVALTFVFLRIRRPA